MKQSRVSAFARAARGLALAAVGLALGAGTLLGQGSTGKIEGRVRDQAGAPIANAQVFVVGTAFNALTNPQGYYFINNVPAGTISVRSAFIGYKSTQVDGVKVLAGQTGTVDIQLEQTAVEIQEITVVSQTQPLVPRDEVTTKQRIDGSVADDLPVDRINDVLALQPGVTVDNDGNLSIRGGRNNEAATYVDGVPDPGRLPRRRVRRLAGHRDHHRHQRASRRPRSPPGRARPSSATRSRASSPSSTKTGGSRVPGLPGLRDRRAVRREQRHRASTGSRAASAARWRAGSPSPSTARSKADGRWRTGMDSQDVPIFLQAGVDTTINQLSVLEDDPATALDETPTGRHHRGPRLQLRRSAAATCDEFAERRRRRHRGRRRASRSRASATTTASTATASGCRPRRGRTYSLNGKLNYTYGTGSRLSLSLAQSRFQGHSAQFTDRLPQHPVHRHAARASATGTAWPR